MLAIVHLTLLAAAAAAAAPAPPTGVGLGTTETAFAGLLVTAILGALGMLVRYLARKSGSELLRLALTKLQWAVGVAVRDVYQTYVEAIKAADADGKLTDEERAIARGMAVTKAKGLLGWDGVKLLAKALGDESAAGASFLVPHIEAEIADAKRTAPRFIKAVGIAEAKPPVDPSQPSVVV